MKITFEIIDSDLNMLLEKYKDRNETIEFVIENTLRNHIDEFEENLKPHSMSDHAVKEREWAKGFADAFANTMKKLGWEAIKDDI